MPVFDQLCRAARQAQEQNLISRQLAERVCAIGADRLHYKHLGLELHSLLAQLAPACSKNACQPAGAIETVVQQIEDKHRRI